MDKSSKLANIIIKNAFTCHIGDGKPLISSVKNICSAEL